MGLTNGETTILFQTPSGKKVSMTVPKKMSLVMCVNFLFEKEDELKLLGIKYDPTEPSSAKSPSISVYENGFSLCSHNEMICSLNKLDMDKVLYFELLRIEDNSECKPVTPFGQNKTRICKATSSKHVAEFQQKDIDFTFNIPPKTIIRETLLFSVRFDIVLSSDRTLIRIVKCKPNDIIFLGYKKYLKMYKAQVEDAGDAGDAGGVVEYGANGYLDYDNESDADSDDEFEYSYIHDITVLPPFPGAAIVIRQRYLLISDDKEKDVDKKKDVVMILRC